MPQDKLWRLCSLQSRRFVSCTALWSRAPLFPIDSALGSYFDPLCITHCNSTAPTTAILGPSSHGESLMNTPDITRLSRLSVPTTLNVSETPWVFVGNVPATTPVAYTSNNLCLKTKSKIAYRAETLVIPKYFPAHCALQVSHGCNIITVLSGPPIMDDFWPQSELSIQIHLKRLSPAPASG